jgi:hypothetical protein
MSDVENRKKENVPSCWEDSFPEKEPLKDWQHIAFTAALEKLQQEHGNMDSVMRMGEAFGRGLFAERIKGKAPDWTIQEWLQEIEKDVWGPLGTEFTFTKISHDVATTFLNRNPLSNSTQEQTAASLFHIGVMRGLFLSAFPQGELVLSEINTKDHPEFIFKTIASAKDKLGREQVIRALTFLKKENTP